MIVVILSRSRLGDAIMLMNDDLNTFGHARAKGLATELQAQIVFGFHKSTYVEQNLRRKRRDDAAVHDIVCLDGEGPRW